MKNVRTAGALMCFLAVISMVLALSLNVVAQPVYANEIDAANPMGNMWVVAAAIAFVLGLVLMFVGFVTKTESNKMYAYGFIAIAMAVLFILLAMFVPTTAEPTGPGTLTSPSKYTVILGPANDTTIGTAYSTYYKWKSVDVNTTSGAIEDGRCLTFNLTLNRESGMTNDVVRAYIKASDIPDSDNGYSIVAKTSGQFQITWTDVTTSASVTGLNKLAVAFPGDGARSRTVQVSIYMNEQAWVDLADSAAAGSQLKLTFESDQAGHIQTVPIDIDLNAYA